MKQSLRQFRALRHGRNIKVAFSGVVLLTGAMIMAPTPVQAGEYVLDHIESADGEVYESQSTPTTRPWTGSQPNSASTTKSDIPSETSYSVSAHSKGKMRAVFVWQPNGPNDNPPLNDTLYAKIDAYTYVPATVAYGQPAGTLSGLVVDDGFGDTPVNQSYSTNHSYVSSGSHLVAMKTNGQVEIKTPFITMHGAATLAGTTGSSSGSASAGAYHSYSAAKDYRGILITSSIETSWKKITNSADLPTKTDPLTGMPYYDTSLIDPNTPWNGSGPWRVQCVRAPDNSMTVHSAATWFEPNPGDTISNSSAWFGRGNYNSNVVGFVNPLFDWQVAGGSVVGTESQQFGLPRYNQPTITLEPAIEDGGSAMTGLNLGGNRLGVGMTKSSNISLKVTESGITAQDDYGITWHLPYEWQPDPSRPTVSKYDWDTNASSWVHADALSHLTVTKNNPNLTWYFMGKSGSLALGAGSVYVGANGLAAAGAALTVPETAGLSLLLFAGGVALNDATPQPEQPEDITINYAMWESAVATQKQKNSNVAANIIDNSTDRLIGFDPAEVENASDDLDSNAPASDDYWNDGLEVKCDIAWNYEESYFLADQYDEHGYVQSNVPGTLHIQKNRYPVYVFRKQGTTNISAPTPDSTPDGL